MMMTHIIIYRRDSISGSDTNTIVRCLYVCCTYCMSSGKILKDIYNSTCVINVCNGIPQTLLSEFTAIDPLGVYQTLNCTLLLACLFYGFLIFFLLYFRLISHFALHQARYESMRPSSTAYYCYILYIYIL